MDKLPEDFKKKWVAALRSGEYKQGTGTIYDPRDNTFCCIGVAAVIAGMDLKESVVGAYNCLPDAINDGYQNEMVASLIHMNDQGITFSKIADWIEENL